MPQPFNYNINVSSPLAKIQEGMNFGSQLRAQAAQRASAEYAQETQSMIGALNKDSTAADYYAVANRIQDPKRAELFANAAKDLTAKKIRMGITDTGQLLNMLQTDPEVYRTEMGKRATAAENSGNEEEAKILRVSAELTKTDVGLAMVIKSIKYDFATAYGEEGRATLESLDKHVESGVGVEKSETEIDLLNTEIKVKKQLLSDMTDKNSPAYRRLEAEIKDLEASAGKKEAETISIKATDLTNSIKALAESDDILTGDAKVANEDKLRVEFNNNTKLAQQDSRQYATIRIAAEDATGQGDLSLIFAFMKMLDPGSVVRESEYAKAAEAQGFFQKMSMLGHKLNDGRYLTPLARKRFAALAKKFIEHSKTYAKGQYWLLKGTADRRGLESRNIFTDVNVDDYGGSPPEIKNREEYAGEIKGLMNEVNSLISELDSQEIQPGLYGSGTIEENALSYKQGSQPPSYLRQGK